MTPPVSSASLSHASHELVTRHDPIVLSPRAEGGGRVGWEGRGRDGASPSLSPLRGQGGQVGGEHRISPCLQGRGVQGRTRTGPCGAHTPLTPVLISSEGTTVDDGAWVGGKGEGEQVSTEAATGPPSAGVSPGCTRRVTPASAGGDVRECIVGSTCPLAGRPDASPLPLFPHPVHGVDRLPLARVGSPGLTVRPSPSLSSLRGQGGQVEGGPQCEHRISPCLQGRGVQGRTRTDPCGAPTVVSLCEHRISSC